MRADASLVVATVESKQLNQLPTQAECTAFMKAPLLALPAHAHQQRAIIAIAAELRHRKAACNAAFQEER